MYAADWKNLIHFSTQLFVYLVLLGIYFLFLGIGLAGWASAIKLREKSKDK